MRVSGIDYQGGKWNFGNSVVVHPQLSHNSQGFSNGWCTSTLVTQL
jgi:hypothetical protein